MKSTVLATLVFWLVIVVCYGLIYVGSHLSIPGLEGYENDWTWQLMFFGFTRLPWLLLALAVILLAEVMIFRRR